MALQKVWFQCVCYLDYDIVHMALLHVLVNICQGSHLEFQVTITFDQWEGRKDRWGYLLHGEGSGAGQRASRAGRGGRAGHWGSQPPSCPSGRRCLSPAGKEEIQDQGLEESFTSLLSGLLTMDSAMFWSMKKSSERGKPSIIPASTTWARAHELLLVIIVVPTPGEKSDHTGMWKTSWTWKKFLVKVKTWLQYLFRSKLHEAYFTEKKTSNQTEKQEWSKMKEQPFAPESYDRYGHCIISQELSFACLNNRI